MTHEEMVAVVRAVDRQSPVMHRAGAMYLGYYIPATHVEFVQLKLVIEPVVVARYEQRRGYAR